MIDFKFQKDNSIKINLLNEYYLFTCKFINIMFHENKLSGPEDFHK